MQWIEEVNQAEQRIRHLSEVVCRFRDRANGIGLVPASLKAAQWEAALTQLFHEIGIQSSFRVLPHSEIPTTEYEEMIKFTWGGIIDLPMSVEAFDSLLLDYIYSVVDAAALLELTLRCWRRRAVD